MRKLFSIFLLFLVMASHTEIIQLFKLPAFYAHYIDHREENKDLGLLGYIFMHYRDSRHASNPHDQLPFKTCHSAQSTIVFNLPEISTAIHGDLVEELVHDLPFILTDEDLLPEALKGSVFQPPKTLA